jgi:alginate O-acetyltransferase complex protein AlgI
MVLWCWYKYANILAATLNGALSLRGNAAGVAAGKAPRQRLPFIALQAISIWLMCTGRRLRSSAALSIATQFADVQGVDCRADHSLAKVSEELQRGLSARTAQGARRFMIGKEYESAGCRQPIASGRCGSLASAWSRVLLMRIGCLAYSLQLFFDRL